MPEEVTLRIRHPQGISTINNLTNFSTISDLKQEISVLVKSDPTDLVLRVGYPPAPVIASDETNLNDAQILTGDTIIVEIHRLEESKTQPRQNDSLQKKSDIPEKQNTKFSQDVSQSQKTDSQNISKKVFGNENNKIDIMPKNETKIEGNSGQQGNQGINPSVSWKNEHVQDMALTEEEFDAQLAKALQESMGVENQIKKESQNEDSDNLFAEFEEKSDPAPINLHDTKVQPDKDSKIVIDQDDDEYAKKLQEELYAEADKNFEAPKYQPNRNAMDIEYEYEPVEFYDTTKQYNQENNLPMDPPLKNDDVDSRLLGMHNPFSNGGNLGPGGNDDGQLQKAIQESLKISGTGMNFSIPAFDDDEDFKRILERSKNEK